MNPKQIYNKYHEGGSFSDKELLEGIQYFKQLATLLSKCGPVFKLAFQETLRIQSGLEDYATARGIIAYDQLVPARVDPNAPVITFQNTLVQKHLSKCGWWHGKFAGVALDLGYPYYDWSGRVYDTKTGQDTGILTDDLK